MSNSVFAIIGATATGKSGLSIDLANKLNGIILSLDSLSIYKEIDIASAKPTKEERKGIPHFGIDVVYPNENFNVTNFIEIYKYASKLAKDENKTLIITGGSSFYLKVLVDGISSMPNITKEVESRVEEIIKKESAYELLKEIDSNIKIELNDKYRLKKAFEIYFATNLPPTLYFKLNPPQPIVPNLPIFEIVMERDRLRRRISKRAKSMLKRGLIDEVARLESKYLNRDLTPMKAVGIKEVLHYFNGSFTQKMEMLGKNYYKYRKSLGPKKRDPKPHHFPN